MSVNMRVKVKICGVRTFEAAIVALDAGADFLGFNFVENSKRRITKQQAKKIADAVRRKIMFVGVFQNQPLGEVNDVAKEIGLDFIQLHGKENNEYIQKVKRPVIKSFTLFDNPEAIKAKYLMLDRVVQGQGDVVNLEKAGELAKAHSLFLAGGLRPENVAEVVTKVRPYAVDVAGGVETNGVQDMEKIRLFIERARSL